MVPRYQWPSLHEGCSAIAALYSSIASPTFPAVRASSARRRSVSKSPTGGPATPGGRGDRSAASPVKAGSVESAQRTSARLAIQMARAPTGDAAPETAALTASRSLAESGELPVDRVREIIPPSCAGQVARLHRITAPGGHVSRKHVRGREREQVLRTVGQVSADDGLQRGNRLCIFLPCDEHAREAESRAGICGRLLDR